ncbi:MAG: hypothetical protein EOM59_13350 [Clostridia bacterium]|nr:hypothetical protein [Clostridia bacterium]
MKISPVMARLIDGMLQPKYDQCKINPDQNTRNKMALLMERKYTKAMTENADCVKGVYSIRKFIQKISANAIQKAVDRLVNNANEGI